MNKLSKLIERYIYDVTRRLPESDRAEVAKELESIIIDMLPENPAEDQVSDAITKLGDPRKMAEQYRTKPRYLISPAMFDMYFDVIKLVIPIVVVVMACFGVIAAVFDSSGFSVANFFGNIFGMGISGAVQAAIWITIGFAIADYVGDKKAWTIADLPKETKNPWTFADLTGNVKKSYEAHKKSKISLAESIGGMIMTIFFTILFIMIILYNGWPFVFVIDSVIINPLTEAAAHRLIPYLIFTASVSFLLSVFKISYRSWNIPLFIGTIFYNVIWVSISIYVLSWSDFFNPAIFEAISNLFEDNQITLNIIEQGAEKARLVVLPLIFIFGAVLDTIDAGIKTFRYRSELPE